NWKAGVGILRTCKTLLVCPVGMRKSIIQLIDKEIKNAKTGTHAEILVKINSLSDRELIFKIYEAAEAGVIVKLIVRGIFCANIDSKKLMANIS
ncbi:RNA degradosome polyphosphate kinase, partial [Acinetobacter baumannii]